MRTGVGRGSELGQRTVAGVRRGRSRRVFRRGFRPLRGGDGKADGDVRAAIWRLAVGLTLMFLLGPDVRFGYFLYPFGLLGWLALTRRPEPQTGAAGHVPEEGEPGPR